MRHLPSTPRSSTMTHSATRLLRYSFVCRLSVLVSVGLLSTARPLHAAKEAKTIVVSVAAGGAEVVRFAGTVERVSVGNPKIADVKVLKPRVLQLLGRELGETVLLVTDAAGRTKRVVVKVGLPVEGMASELAALFPGDSITVRSVGGVALLSGTVSDALTAKRAEELAKAYAKRHGGQGSVLNHLQVEGRQQVQLRVKIAEVSRSAMREMGINMWQRGKRHSGGLLAPTTSLSPTLTPSVQPGLQAGGQLQALEGDSRPPVPLLSTPLSSGGGAFGLHLATAGSFPLAIALSLLQGSGLAKVLSEPTLVAYSGQKAEFLAGGEFPIPIPQGLGQSSIEFKRFGVELNFTPVVLADRTIHLQMSVSVSERDQAGAVQLEGTSVPALTTRQSQTTVRMRSGQSLAIAGLLQDRIAAVSSRIPLLGDLPVVGMLFRQTSFERQERELVILVTPHLVRPLKAGEVPALPGEEEVADPGSVAFFLLGTIDPELRTKRKSGPAGPVGYGK